MVEPVSKIKKTNCPANPIDLSSLPRAKGTYLVGGTVRDLLLGRQPVDYDLVVTGSPEAFANRLLKLTPGRQVVIGRRGQAVVRVVTAEGIFDLCPLNGGHIEEDLSKRDFSINAMAYSLSSGRLVDPFGGREDIAAQTIRMVSPTVFQKDPARLLRAYRLAAQLAFRIEKSTAAGLAKDAFLIRKPAGERLREELFKLLSSRGATGYLAEMAHSGVLLHLFPELEKLKGCLQQPPHRHDVFDHTLEMVAQLETLLESPLPSLKEFQHLIGPFIHRDAGARLKCAALLHDIGKPACRSIDIGGRVHFYGHADRSAQLALEICRRLRFSNSETETIATIVRHHTRILSLFAEWERECLSARAVTRLFKACKDRSPEIILHALADMKAKRRDDKTTRAFERFCVELIGQFYSRFKPIEAQPPLISGHDLKQRFGLKPSPLFGRLLDQAETARLSGSIKTKTEAEALVQELLDKEAHKKTQRGTPK